MNIPETEVSYFTAMSEFYMNVYKHVTELFEAIRTMQNAIKKAKGKQIEFVISDENLSKCCMTVTETDDREYKSFKFGLKEVRAEIPKDEPQSRIAIQADTLAEKTHQFVKQKFSAQYGEELPLSDLIVYKEPFKGFATYVNEDRVYELKVDKQFIEKINLPGNFIQCRKYGFTGQGIANMFINKCQGSTMTFIASPDIMIYRDNDKLIPEMIFNGIELIDLTQREDVIIFDDFEEPAQPNPENKDDNFIESDDDV